VSDSSIQLPLEGKGKKMRTLEETVDAETVQSQVVAVEDGAGNVVDPREVVEQNAGGIKVDLKTDTLGGLKVLEKNSSGVKVDIATDSLAAGSGLKTVPTFQLPVISTLTWTNCTTTNVAPDTTDLVIDVSQAKSIAIQADSTNANSDATSIDINVISSPDGSSYDTTPYAEMNIGDAEVKTMLVEPGPSTIKLRLDKNTGGTRADVTVKVKVRN
jgi:hypothetical protein